MNKRKLMIMGAGIYQVPLIQKAKEMNLEVLVVSVPGNYPGIMLADKFFSVDTRDAERVLEIAKEENISGICTSGTDVAVRTIGYVNEHMGLNGIGYEAACRVTDKALMKEVFQKGNVSTAQFRKVYSEQEALEAADEIGYPVIVKAVDSSGSRGIQKAGDQVSLKSAYASAKEVTKKEYVLVEEYIIAREIGVDGYVGEDGVKIVLPHTKFTYSVDGVTIPSGHAFPYVAEENQLNEIKRQMDLATKALGLRNCPFNADVFVKDDRVWIIEMGGRTGATCIPELISIHKEYDWYEKIICAALGEDVSFESDACVTCMAKLLFSDTSGSIVAIDEKIIEETKGFCEDIHLDYKAGDSVDAVRNGTDRIGHLIMKETTERELDQYLEKIRSAITIK